MISEMIQNSINKYGVNIEVLNANNQVLATNFKALIQPVKQKITWYSGLTNKEIGVLQNFEYLYTGPKDIPIDTFALNSIIKTDTENFVLKRAQKYYFKDNVIFIWAILQKCSTGGTFL